MVRLCPKWPTAPDPVPVRDKREANSEMPTCSRIGGLILCRGRVSFRTEMKGGKNQWPIGGVGAPGVLGGGRQLQSVSSSSAASELCLRAFGPLSGNFPRWDGRPTIDRRARTNLKVWLFLAVPLAARIRPCVSDGSDEICMLRLGLHGIKPPMPWIAGGPLKHPSER